MAQVFPFFRHDAVDTMLMPADGPRFGDKHKRFLPPVYMCQVVDLLLDGITIPRHGVFRGGLIRPDAFGGRERAFLFFMTPEGICRRHGQARQEAQYKETIQTTF